MLKDYYGNTLTLRDYNGHAISSNYAPAAEVPLIDPDTPAEVQPVGMSGYNLVFSDEFKTGSLNTDKWIPWYPDTTFWNVTEPGGHRTNSFEPQGYDPSGISFDEDGMVFTLREEETVAGLSYTSGMVASYPSFNTTYGYFEARMLLADVPDAWPAFWMMPTRQVRHPEYDIMENDGKTSFNNITYHTLHSPEGANSTNYGYPEDVGNEWHTFGLLWEPTRLRWYVDGVQVKDLMYSSDDPMYLICNLAGKKESTPPAPFSIKISHIRGWALPG